MAEHWCPSQAAACGAPSTSHQSEVPERPGAGQGSWPSAAPFSGAPSLALPYSAPKPRALNPQVGILVVNCSLFCPTPSLASCVMRAFKMRSDTVSYNLGGMGCSGERV